MTRVTDAYIDRLIEKSAYEERIAVLLRERATVKEEVGAAASGSGGIQTKLACALELMRTLQNKDDPANSSERLRLLKSACSNLGLRGKSLVPTWDSPVDVLANRTNFDFGAPRRGATRTCKGHSVCGANALNHKRNNLFCKILKRVEEQVGSILSPQVPTSSDRPH
jgi:hypothetical protein